jgi:hypothetical protein
MEPFDIQGDGVFGMDDMKAYIGPRPGDDPTDMCSISRIGFLKREVEWKLKTLLAGKLTRHETSASEIDGLENDALNRLQQLSSKNPNRLAAARARAYIVELSLRAKALLVNPAAESFGTGVAVKPHPTSQGGWPMQVTSVIPDSGAARVGIRRGDALIAVGGKPFEGLSSDGTVQGLYDPQTNLSRGFGGSWGSIMHLQVRRSTGALVELQVERNIWSARTLGTPNTLPLWDGKEMPKTR